MWSRCVLTVASRDEQPGRRAAVRLALGDQREDLELAVAQRVRAGARSWLSEPRRDRRREHGLAARTPLAPRRTSSSRGEILRGGSRSPRPRSPGPRRCRCRRSSGRGPAPGCRSRRAGGSPLRRRRPGIRRSIRMTSGRSRSAQLDRLARRRTPRRRPRTPGRRRSMPRRPSRTTGWSSTMSRRIGGHGAVTGAWTPIAGTRADTAVPPPGSDSIASVPATRLTRWRIAGQPEAVARPRPTARRPRTRCRRRGRRASRRRP